MVTKTTTGLKQIILTTATFRSVVHLRATEYKRIFEPTAWLLLFRTYVGVINPRINKPPLCRLKSVTGSIHRERWNGRSEGMYIEEGEEEEEGDLNKLENYSSGEGFMHLILECRNIKSPLNGMERPIRGSLSDPWIALIITQRRRGSEEQVDYFSSLCSSVSIKIWKVSLRNNTPLALLKISEQKRTIRLTLRFYT